MKTRYEAFLDGLIEYFSSLSSDNLSSHTLKFVMLPVCLFLAMLPYLLLLIGALVLIWILTGGIPWWPASLVPSLAWVFHWWALFHKEATKEEDK